MKPKTLLIYYNSDVNVDISYQFGWVKAFRKSNLFDCDYLNLSNFFPIYKKKPRLEANNSDCSAQSVADVLGIKVVKNYVGFK